MPELDLWGSGRNPSEHRMMSESKTANTTDKKPATGGATMEAIVARENMLLALRAVERIWTRNLKDEGIGFAGTRTTATFM